MKITADWVSYKPLSIVFDLLETEGYQVFVVGGAVRNAVMGLGVSDIDLSTDATPDQVTNVFRMAGLKTIPTGADHGTVTVVVDAMSFEITTFRTDVETFGRKARVAFTDDLVQDAMRRDFTMNALYAKGDGTLVDPLGGLDDAKSRYVRFIENPGKRIQEDYLRILRFFRFNAVYSTPEVGIDAEGLAAIAQNLDGLHQVAHERIGAEMRKLLAAPDPSVSIAAMEQTGVLAYVLPGAQCGAISRLIYFEQEHLVHPEPIRRLVALGGANDADDLRLSRKEKRRLLLLKSSLENMMPAAELGYRLGSEAGLDVLLLRAALFEQPIDREQKTALKKGSAAVFPIKPADLMPEYEGPDLGDRLAELEQHWIDTGFALSKQDLI